MPQYSNFVVLAKTGDRDARMVEIVSNRETVLEPFRFRRIGRTIVGHDVRLQLMIGAHSYELIVSLIRGMVIIPIDGEVWHMTLVPGRRNARITLQRWIGDGWA